MKWYQEKDKSEYNLRWKARKNNCIAKVCYRSVSTNYYFTLSYPNGFEYDSSVNGRFFESCEDAQIAAEKHLDNGS